MSDNKLSVVIAGATGYVGLDLVYWLTKHPKVKIKYLCAQKNIGKKISNFDRRIKKKLPKISDLNNVNWNNVDLLFLTLPPGEAQKVIKNLFKYKNLKFIDLSADFRIESTREYKKWYSLDHNAKELIAKSIYSIPEFTKNKIKNYRIVANPGCYPTSIQLPLIPLIRKNLINYNNIIIDSKSGYSGAGKNFIKKFTHKNFYNSVYAYSVNKHRHMSEIDQELYKIHKIKINFIFNPHLLPVFRGLISSIYIEVKKNVNAAKIHKELKRFHKDNNFIKILKLNNQIGTGNVLNTNMCEISVCETRIKKRVVVFSAIDNLIKGASGQAIQNMNLIFGFNEKSGL